MVDVEILSEGCKIRFREDPRRGFFPSGVADGEMSPWHCFKEFLTGISFEVSR